MSWTSLPETSQKLRSIRKLMLHVPQHWKLPKSTITKHRAMKTTVFSSMKTNPRVKHRLAMAMLRQQCWMLHHQSCEKSQHRRRRRQLNQKISTSVTKQTLKVKQLPGKRSRSTHNKEKKFNFISALLEHFPWKIELNFLCGSSFSGK